MGVKNNMYRNSAINNIIVMVEYFSSNYTSISNFNKITTASRIDTYANRKGIFQKNNNKQGIS